MNWTQAICDDCWDERNPDRLSPHLSAGFRERCCWCGISTVSGIYVREDPRIVPFPADDTVLPEVAVADGLAWAQITRAHPRIALDRVRPNLDSFARMLAGYDEDVVSEGLLVEANARLSVLYRPALRRFTAVATDPFGVTVWWEASISQGKQAPDGHEMNDEPTNWPEFAGMLRRGDPDELHASLPEWMRPPVADRPPVGLADVSPGLIEAIDHLFDEYGPLGVERTVVAMRARMTT